MTAMQKVVNEEAADDLARALVRTAGEHMMTHGPDPEGAVIVAAAFFLALNRIGEIDAGIPETVRGLLQNGAS